MIDFSTNNIVLEILGEATTWLSELNTALAVLLFAIFGLLSPPLGAPFTIYPILVAFVFFLKSGSKAEAILWGTCLTLLFIPPGALLGFFLSRYVLRARAEKMAKKVRGMMRLLSPPRTDPSPTARSPRSSLLSTPYMQSLQTRITH